MTKLTSTVFFLLAVLFMLGGCGDGGSHLAGPFIDAPAVCCPATADDWPQYRGLNRDGAAATLDLVPWPRSGPGEVWRRPLGEGFASLAIKGDRLFTSANDLDKEVLLCLDADTGNEVWRLAMGASFTEEYGNGPRSTPTIDDRGIVYVLSSRAVLLAANSEDGMLIWSRDLHPQFGGRGYDRGYSSSPLVEGELLILNMGPEKGGAVVAIERISGAIVWSSQDGVAAYSSPVAVNLGGQRQIVTSIGRGVVALDPADGRLLWEYEWKTQYGLNIAMPVVLPGDQVLLSSGYDQGAVLLGITKTMDGWAAEPRWTQRLFRNHFSTSVYHDGLVFGFDNSILKCLDAETGEEQWASRGFGKGSLVRVGDTLVVLSDKGEVALVQATGEAFQELSRVRVLTGGSWTAPAVAAGRLYLRSSSEIVSLDLNLAATG